MGKLELDESVKLADELFYYVMTAMDVFRTPHDYGTGDVLNMVEMHTLATIASNPGICVSDVARLWNRTLGAASRNVDRLQSRGWVRKEKLPGNDKTVHLYPTEEGVHLAELHREYDKREIELDLEMLRENHSDEELRNFFDVLRSLQHVLEERHQL